MTHPVVTVEAGGEAFRARAVVTEGTERDRLFAAHAAVDPAFNGYKERTSRLIPVVALDRLDERPPTIES